MAKDIFVGKYLEVWEDSGLLYISFPYVVLSFSKDEWKGIRKELKKL